MRKVIFLTANRCLGKHQVKGLVVISLDIIPTRKPAVRARAQTASHSLCDGAPRDTHNIIAPK
jgi:uncharacterized protein YcsI (UPF0317 family)